MTTLLVAEHHVGGLSDQTAKALTAALALGADVDVLVAGHQIEGIAAQASALAGIRKVLAVDDPRLAAGLSETFADLVSRIASGYDAVVAAATSAGKSFMPRVAVSLDVMQISEVSEVLGPDTFKRPIYAGNAVHVVQSHDPIKVLTVRTASFSAASTGTPPAEIETVQIELAASPSNFIGAKLSQAERPQLTSARVIVAGGRALGSSEKFEHVIFPLADKLGAAVGASRAAVDAGYAPNDWQVGQTGKVVAPDLYVACGISGAIQHLAGMKDSKVIVAINKDPDAPIFQVADYGLVGDLFETVPELVEFI